MPVTHRRGDPHVDTKSTSDTPCHSSGVRQARHAPLAFGVDGNAFGISDELHSKTIFFYPILIRSHQITVSNSTNSSYSSISVLTMLIMVWTSRPACSPLYAFKAMHRRHSRHIEEWH